MYPSPLPKADAPNPTAYGVFLTPALDTSLEKAQLFATLEPDFSKETFPQAGAHEHLALVGTALGLRNRLCSNAPELWGCRTALGALGTALDMAAGKKPLQIDLFFLINFLFPVTGWWPDSYKVPSKPTPVHVRAQRQEPGMKVLPPAGVKDGPCFKRGILLQPWTSHRRAWSLNFAFVLRFLYGPAEPVCLGIFLLSCQMRDPLCCKQIDIYYFCLKDAGYTWASGA